MTDQGRIIILKGDDRIPVDWNNTSLSSRYMSHDILLHPEKTDLNNPESEFNTFQVLKNLEITTMTINGNVSNISFDETRFKKNPEEETETPIVETINKEILHKVKEIGKSRIIEILSSYCHIGPNQENLDAIDVITKKKYRLSTSKKGRKSKKSPDIKQFHSQITISVLSKNYPTTKIYNFKLFRTGSISIPGVFDMIDGLEAVMYLISMLNQARVELSKELQAAQAITPIISKLIEVNVVMINYKSAIDIPPNKIIVLRSLSNYINKYNQELNEDKSANLYDIDNENTNIEGANSTNCVSIVVGAHLNSTQSYNEKVIRFNIAKACSGYQSARGVHITVPKEKKDSYTIEIYPSGKINVKGQYEVDDMISKLKLIEHIFKLHSSKFLADISDDYDSKFTEKRKHPNISNPLTGQSNDEWLTRWPGVNNIPGYQDASIQPTLIPLSQNIYTNTYVPYKEFVAFNTVEPENHSVNIDEVIEKIKELNVPRCNNQDFIKLNNLIQEIVYLDYIL